MSVFEKRRKFVKSLYVVTVALVCLSACSGSGSVPVSTNLNALTHNAAVRPQLTSASFTRVATWGAKGVLAVAQCPQGFKVIAGGSSSSNGDSVGTGYANVQLHAWVVKPPSNASAEAFATCVTSGGAKEFKWRTAGSSSGLAAAQCRPGYTLVTGYTMGTSGASWFDPDTNTYWVSGGGAAYASCASKNAGIVIRHAWNESQHPKAVFAGCGTGYTVVGGSMGDSAWPGPPIQQHPGVASGPGNHGNDGWWTFSNATNELTWAACIRK